MPENQGEPTLKVCLTCRYWSYKYKGLCERLNQGAGRFWICADWQAVGELETASPGEGPQSAESHRI